MLSRFASVFVIVAFASIVAGAATVERRQTGYITVIVNSRALTGPNSAAREAGGKILAPLHALAQALGSRAAIDHGLRTVTIVRQNNVVSVFDARLGQIRENGIVILSISGTGEVAFASTIEEFMLPVEVAAALLDVSIRSDPHRNALIVNSRLAAPNVRTSRSRGRVEVYSANYEYSLNHFARSSSHGLSLSTVGRAGDSRFFLSTDTFSSAGSLAIRRTSFDLERPNGQRLAAGDVTAAVAVPFLTTSLRGAAFTLSLGKTNVGAFGGRASSGSFGSASAAGKFNFDTTVRGGYAVRQLSHELTLTAGAVAFSGSHREGSLAATGANFSGAKLRLQFDAAAGRFDDRSGGRTARAVDLAGTYQISPSLAMQARFARTGKAFITPQSGVRQPLDVSAAGMTWSPVTWLTTSINASTSRRPDTAQEDRFVTASLAFTPGREGPSVYFSHTQSRSQLLRSAAFTLVNASYDVRRWRLYLNATRVKTSGKADLNTQFGAATSLNDRHSIEIGQGFGNHGSYNGAVDWRASGVLSRRVNFAVGTGYSRTRDASITTFQRVTASVGMSRGSSLQLAYVRTDSGPTLQLSFRGTLFKKRDAASYIDAGVAEAAKLASLSGRVFQDVNENGVYDGGVDRPQAHVKVRVDGNRYVETDDNGVFRLDALTAGEHKVYLDLLSVRADLTLLDGGTRDLILTGGRDVSRDFRLIRTGRITGRAWHDLNSNGEIDEDELPLANVRVFTASGRDTLTDSEGFFTLADLAPGEHSLLIDEGTLPDKVVSSTRTLLVKVLPGRSTDDVVLMTIPRPADVKRFTKPAAQ